LNFYSNGKLLITAEYLVIDGAKALAVPTKFGQNLEILKIKTTKNTLFWNSFNYNNKPWFYCEFDLLTLNFTNETNLKTAKTLQFILRTAQKLNPKFLTENKSLKVNTNLTFNKKWGLGTSSTLINNIANWAKVDAYKLQFKVFGGSAYDIACAKNNTSILYSLNKNQPKIKKITFNPEFKNQLYFLYLNKNQNSRNAISNYKKMTFNKSKIMDEINEITNNIIHAKSIATFDLLIKKHEQIISKIIDMPTVQETYFKNYFGQIKSLGAWGGDFILATGNKETPNYFKEKGFNTVIPFDKMVL
jgi:mevalonate kinase